MINKNIIKDISESIEKNQNDLKKYYNNIIQGLITEIKELSGHQYRNTYLNTIGFMNGSVLEFIVLEYSNIIKCRFIGPPILEILPDMYYDVKSNNIISNVECVLENPMEVLYEYIREYIESPYR